MKKQFFCLIIFVITTLLVQGIGFDNSPKKKSIEEKKSKKRITVNTPKKNFGRAFLECALLEAGATINYWRKYARFIEDWQYELTWEDQKKRFFSFEALKFDSNNFQLNWTHSLAGAIHFNFARTNGFNTFESFLFTSVHSLFWEYISEWREVVSINDNVFTILGGVPIGESVFQLGSYFYGKKGFVNKIFSFITNPILNINRMLDSKNKIYEPSPKNDLFIMNMGLLQQNTKSKEPETQLYLGLHTKLHRIEKFKEPSNLSVTLNNIPLNTIFFNIRIGERGIEEVNSRLRVVYTGYLRQKIELDSDQNKKGFSLLLGLGTGFEYIRRRALHEYDGPNEFVFVEETPIFHYPVEFTEKKAAVNLIGPSLDLSIFRKDFQMDLMVSFYPDFAMVNSYALGKFSKNTHLGFTKSTLSNFGYYYAYGFSLTSDLLIKYKNFQFGTNYRFHYYNSIEGVDRMQTWMKYDYNLIDSKSVLRLSAGYRFLKSSLLLEIASENIKYNGWIEDTHDSGNEFRTYLQTSILF